MSPQSGFEIGLTPIEVDLMAVFVKHRVFDDRHNAVLLMQLANKLEEANAKAKAE